jgi:hypothetical protein
MCFFYPKTWSELEDRDQKRVENLTEKYKSFSMGDIYIDLTKEFECTLSIYVIQNCLKYRKISFQQRIENKEGRFNFALLKFGELFGLMLPNGRKEYKIIDRFFCLTCGNWLTYRKEQDFKREHCKNCVQCNCGRAYQEGDTHYLFCNKANLKPAHLRHQKSDPLLAKIYKKSKKKGPIYNKKNNQADLECFPKTLDNNKFITYSACLYNADKNDYWIDYGPFALSRFIEEILQLEGILWFFCGSRFDLYFILEYLVRNNIDAINTEETLISAREIRILSLKTKNGKKLLIKDLGYFLPGSLDSNCKGLGIPLDETKSSFKHEKIKSWSDVEFYKEEHLKYLKQDVVAQKACFERVSQQFWDDYKLDLCKFISLSQLAYAAFTTYLKEEDKLLWKVPIERNNRQVEKDLREAYRGGRLVMTYPLWKSSQYEEILNVKNDSKKLGEIYEILEDCIHYMDKVSLYPSVMHKERYPCGQMFYVEGVETEVLNEILATYQDENPIWKYRLLKVDIIPPRDIYIAFIMDRDEHKRNQQNLNPKESIWLTGAEVVEALKIGYQLTKVHAYYYWEKTEYLFREFIEVAMSRKNQAAKEGKKETAAYLIPKNVMNGSSGKMGQLGKDIRTHLIIGDKIRMEDIVQKETCGIWDKDELLAVFVDEKVKRESTPYPLHLSVFILGYSRVNMSEFTRLINGYRDPSCVPFYGDTDSLFVHQRALSQIDPKEIGNELGQMKYEKPNHKTIGIIAMAPKTRGDLAIEKITHKVTKVVTYKLVVSITSKGIPHRRESFLMDGNYSLSKLIPTIAQEIIQIANFLEERSITKDKKEKAKHFYKTVFLKDKYYIRTKGEEVEVKDRITWEDMNLVLHNEANIICLYGGMIRNLKSSADIDEMGISLDYIRRSLSKTLWWEKGFRNITTLFPNELTTPIGFSV